jgi:ribonuclease HI
MGNNAVLSVDVSARLHPGPASWVAIVSWPNGDEITVGGRRSLTTRHRVELIATSAGLRELGPDPQRLTLITTSVYIFDAMNKGWAARWQAGGWTRTRGRVCRITEPVPNADLWDQLWERAAPHTITWKFVYRDNIPQMSRQVAQELANLNAGRIIPITSLGAPDPGYVPWRQQKASRK